MIPVWGGINQVWWNEGYPGISMENSQTTHQIYIHKTPSSGGVYFSPTGTNVGNNGMQFNFSMHYLTDA